MLRAELRDTHTEDTPAPRLTAFAVRGSFHTIFFSKKLKARIVFFILPVTQTLPFICLFCSLSFGTIEKIAYLCSTNSIGLCTCYIKDRAVGRLPFLLSIVEEQAKGRERTARTNLTRCRYGLYQPKTRGQTHGNRGQMEKIVFWGTI